MTFLIPVFTAIGGAISSAGAAVAGTATTMGTAITGGAATGAAATTIGALNIASIGASAIGGITTAVQGIQTKNLYEYNAQVARQNAAYEADRKRREILSIAGTQQAAYGSAGLAMSGSAMDVFADTIRRGTIDELMIKNNGLSQSYSMQQQGSMAQSSGITNGLVGTAGTLLGSAASIYGGGMKAGLWGNTGTITA